MGGAKRTGGRSSRGRRALCGVWAGVDVPTWGEGGGKRPDQSTSNLRSHEWRAGEMPGRAVPYATTREDQEGKVGRPPAPVAESPGAAHGAEASTAGIGSGVG